MAHLFREKSSQIALYEGVVDGSPIGMILFDLATEIVIQANQSAESIVGLEPGGLLGKIHPFVTPDEEHGSRSPNFKEDISE